MPINRDDSRDPRQQRQGSGPSKDPETGQFISIAEEQKKQDAINAKKQKQRDKEALKIASEVNKELKNIGKDMGERGGNLIERAQDLAKLNKKIVKENADLFSKKAAEFLDQAAEMQMTIDTSNISSALEDKLKSLIEISDSAATANFSELKSLRTNSTATLKSLEIMATNDESEEMQEMLKFAREQVKMLKGETSLLSEIGNGISELSRTGIGAIVGVATNSPIAAMGINAIQQRGETKKDAKAEMVKSQIETIKKEREAIAEKAKSFDTDFEDEFGDRLISVFDNALAEIIPDDATEEERDKTLLEVAASLSELVGVNEAEKDMFSTWLSGSEEERREALDRDRDKLQLFDRMADALESLAKDKEEEDLGLVDIALGNLIADAVTSLAGKLKAGIALVVSGLFNFLKNLPKKIGRFITKALPKFLSRFFVLGTIVGALFSGISDAIDEFRKSGDIWKAVSAGLAGVLDFITFGLINEEMGKKIFNEIGSMFGKVIDWVGDLFSTNIGGIKEFVLSAWDKIVSGVKGMFTDFISDWENIRDTFSKFEWVQSIQAGIQRVVDRFVYGWDTISEGAKNLWNKVTSKWDSVKTAIIDVFDWFSDIFSVDTFKKLIPEGMFADALFGKELTQEEINAQNGVDRAKESGIINRNIVGKSTVEDVAELNNLTAKQLMDLLDLDDWSRDDEQKIRDAYKRQIEKGVDEPDVVGQARRQPLGTIAQDNEQIEIISKQEIPETKTAKNEMVGGETKAQQIETAQIQSEQRAKQARQMQEQAKRKTDQAATSKTFISNSTNNNSTVLSQERTYDTDQMAARYENKNYAG